MSRHYRLRLLYGVSILDEVHKDLPRLAYGWGRRMRETGLYVLIDLCPDDEDCTAYVTWRAVQDVRQDDAEAEHLRGEDVRPSPPGAPLPQEEASG